MPFGSVRLLSQARREPGYNKGGDEENKERDRIQRITEVEGKSRRDKEEIQRQDGDR